MMSINEKSMNFNKRIKVDFDGGDLTRDAGLILYQEFNHVIGLHQMIEEMIDIKDNGSHRYHQNHDVIMQKIFQLAAGYYADNHADDLRYDPVFTTILNKPALASQPTISRVNQLFNMETMKQFQETNQLLIDRFHKLEKPKTLVLDIDSANSPTYGDQYGSSYNPHYGENGYHPLFMFEGETGDCLKASLRAGHVYTSRQVVSFVGPELKRLKQKHPKVNITLRGDSGFATPELYKLCEQLGADYVIRLKANQRLQRIAKEFEQAILSESEIAPYEGHHVFYHEFTYKAASWDKSRKVMLKLEKPTDELLFIPTFVVTTLTDCPKDIIQFYADRGKMENYIKEGKLGFAFGKMSSTQFEVNANKLQIAVLAYNLNNGLRRFCLPQKMKGNQIQTLRTRIIKIAGKVIRSGRYITFKLASSSLYKNEFFHTLHRIQTLLAPC